MISALPVPNMIRRVKKISDSTPTVSAVVTLHLNMILKKNILMSTTYMRLAPQQYQTVLTGMTTIIDARYGKPLKKQLACLPAN